MLDIIDLVVNKETIVRKRITSFIEKLFRYIKADFKHDTYKAIVYAEEECITELEVKMKMVYDSFLYLLFNRKNQLSIYILDTFFQIYLGYKLEITKIQKICNKHYLLYDETPIDRAILFSSYIMEELDNLYEDDKIFISLIMFNYCLTIYEIPCIQFLTNQIEEYMQLIKEFQVTKNIEKVYIYIISMLSKQKFQDKTHYSNLRDLNVSTIYKEINQIKEELKNDYFVKNIYLYGSYAKSKNRRDSDLDLLVSFNLDLLSDEKEKIKEKLKDYLYKKFNTFIDIHELSNYVVNDRLIENKKIKKLL